MTFNAAHSNSKILEIIPDYLWRHYTYLRDKFPSCFLEIQVSTARIVLGSELRGLTP